MIEWFSVFRVCFSSYWLFLAAGAVLRFLVRKTSKPWLLPVGLLIAAAAVYLLALSLGGEQWMLLAVIIATTYAAIGAAVCGVVLRVLARKKR